MMLDEASAGLSGATGGRWTGRRIAVIGAGFSGVMTAIHLLWRCAPGDRVWLIERRVQLGQGVAYSTTAPEHLLNVRSESMSAFADEPGHFNAWFQALPPAERAAAGEPSPVGTYVQRRVYAQYLKSLLHEAMVRHGTAKHLYIVHDEATAIRQQGGELAIETDGGRTYQVDAAVLALGNLGSAPPEATSRLAGWFNDAWDPAAIAGLDPEKPIVIRGAGLTMADLAMSIAAGGFKGRIHAISRRGLLPLPHQPSQPWTDLQLPEAGRESALGLFRAIRGNVKRAAAAGVGWRGVIDSLRPHTQKLWQGMSLPARASFLRHLRTIWDVHRHRLAPAVAERLQALQDSGQLTIEAGRIRSIEAAPEGGIAVTWTPRRQREAVTVVAQRVIDCVGPATDYARIADPLVRQLLADGLARPDALRLGLDCDQDGMLLTGDGTREPRILALGPVTRSAFWEITAVPDIRGQAEKVALRALAAASPKKD